MLCISKSFVGSSQTLRKLASAPSTRLCVKRIQKQISIAQGSWFHQSSHSNNPLDPFSSFRNYAQRQNTIRYRGLTTGTNVESKPSGTLTEQPAKASTAPIPQLTNPPPISQLSSTTGYIQYDLSTQSPHSFFLPQQNQDLRQPEDKAKLNFTRFRLRSDKPIHVLLLQIQDDNPHVKDVCVYTFDETSVAGSITSSPGEQKATTQSGNEKTRCARSALLDDVIKDALKSETRKFELAVTYTAANGSGSSVKNIEVLLPSFHGNNIHLSPSRVTFH
ncbi:hypothetical protein BKA69DRAFT_236447 [Paraphysoderma sedebokerense]|nr:hypothetical protein BKA69DRAFT_236447 [Paraphysoderma sedebokerense]